MKLDLSSFDKAVSQLEQSLGYLASDLAKKDAALKSQFRGAAIQAFEYTYEICVKMLRRQLEQMAATPVEVKQMAFMDMIRWAAEAGLVPDVRRFREYRERRNLTTHTYDENRAREIADSLGAFLKDAQFILTALKKRNV